MTTKRKIAERELLKQFNIELAEIFLNPVIGQALAESGYDKEYLDEGKRMLEETEERYWMNLAEKDRLSAAYEVLRRKREALDMMFNLHRNKARIAFRFRRQVLKKIGASGNYPTLFAPLMDAATDFYNTLSMDAELLGKMKRYGITEKVIEKGLLQINEVKAANSYCIDRKASSKVATTSKNEAFQNLTVWMSDLRAMTRLVLKDQSWRPEPLKFIS